MQLRRDRRSNQLARSPRSRCRVWPDTVAFGWRAHLTAPFGDGGLTRGRPRSSGIKESQPARRFDSNQNSTNARRRFPPPWSVEGKTRGGGALGTAKAPLLSPPHVDTLYVPATQSRSY